MENGLPPETFGELVLRMRRRAKVSAAELARRVGYKDRKTVERWEDGESVPGKEEIFPALASELGIPAETLMRLAGVESSGPLKADPTIAKLADQAGDLERRLRALATAPTSTGEGAVDRVLGRTKGGKGTKRQRGRGGE